MQRNIPINRVTSEPAVEPVFAAEVKENAYIVDDCSYDQLLDQQLIPAARRFVEQMANRSLITQTRAQYYDDLPYEILFRYSPVQSVTSITYKDTNEDQQTLSSSLYTVDTASHPCRIVQGYDDTYPTSICDTNSVVVTAVCGYGATGATVPIIYRRAIILIASHWLHNRGLCAVDGDLLHAVETLLAVEGSTVEYA